MFIESKTAFHYGVFRKGIITMNDELLEELRRNETDVDGALYRLSGDTGLYMKILSSFVLDGTILDLEKALTTKSWDAAFTAVHALKGLAGNLGFAPLFHSLGELVIVIRAGRLQEINESFLKVKHYYDDIVTVINNHLNVIENEEEDV